MASRAGLAAVVLSLFLLSQAATGHQVPATFGAVEKADDAVADPILRLPSERSVHSEERRNPVAEVEERRNPVVEVVPVDYSLADPVPQDVEASPATAEIADQDRPSTAETTTLETAEPATAIPSSELKVNLIPVRAGIHRVHLTGPLPLRKGSMSFWFLRPRRHHSRLFHRLFLDGREGARQPMEVRFGGGQDEMAMRLQRVFQLPLPEEMMQQDQQEQEQPVPKVLAFRIRRLGPHHHHHGMMHNCAWRKRLEALTQTEEGEERQDGFTGLMKRFTVFHNPLQN